MNAGITTAQSLGGSPVLSSTGGLAGAQYLRSTGTSWRVSPPGFSGSLSGLRQDYSNTLLPGIAYTTAGFDPVVVAQLTVRLRSNGQIWPVGYS